MKIYCADREDLIDTIEHLFLKGIQFDADTGSRIITLTGGF